MANPNDPRTKRRNKMGDPTGKMDIAPQPMPGLPQGQGNMMNNPLNGLSFNAQIGALEGVNKFPYGDGGIPVNDGRMGAVGPAGNSGMQQNMVQGQGYNTAPYGIPQLSAPDNQSAGMMESTYMAQTAAGRAGKLYAGQDPTPSYQVQPGLGMSGTPTPAIAQGETPGQIPFEMTEQTGMNLPLQGVADVQGMNTKRGGGRNQKPA